MSGVDSALCVPIGGRPGAECGLDVQSSVVVVELPGGRGVGGAVDEGVANVGGSGFPCRQFGSKIESPYDEKWEGTLHAQGLLHRTDEIGPWREYRQRTPQQSGRG